MIDSYFDYLNGLTTFNLVILLVFSGLYLIRFISRWLSMGRLILLKSTNNNQSSKVPVSLISSVRNEEENVKTNFSKLLSIQNANFELVVVDDYSQDNTYVELGRLKERFKNLVVSSLSQETRNSYKLGLNIALKAAKNDWVLLIPAGINTFSSEWLKTITNILHDDKTVILNYSNVEKQKGFFNHLYRIEKFLLQMKSFSYALNLLPFVYFEENIVFKREKYFEGGGFTGNINEPYANLELVINKFINRNSFLINLNKESAFFETSVITKKEYFDLIKKSFRIKTHLTAFKRFILSLGDIIRLVYLPFLILVFLIHPGLWLVLSVLIFIRILNDVFIMKIMLNRLNERKIFISSLIYELVVPYVKFVYWLYFRRQSRNLKWRSIK